MKPDRELRPKTITLSGRLDAIDHRKALKQLGIDQRGHVNSGPYPFTEYPAGWECRSITAEKAGDGTFLVTAVYYSPIGA